ncbi:MAG: PAS-domain containing protein [Gammaproteobacteria bacterium]|nr:PAS-domain containing protein [Gammaproteobacteria bacterium]
MSIPARVISLSAILLLALVGSNLYLARQLTGAADVLELDKRLVENLGSAIDASRSFGDLKYWLLALAVDGRPDAREQVAGARTRVEDTLESLRRVEPESVAVLNLELDALTDSTMIAIEAYADGSTDRGDAFLAKGLEHIAVVDRRLRDLVELLRVEASYRRDSELADTRRAASASMIVIVIAAVLGAVLTVMVLRSIQRPLNRLMHSMQAIAGADAQAPLDLRASDEIGAMTRTLELYRESLSERDRLAAEHQSTTLRLRDTRRQLDEAIESISAAFALFDTSDRLVLSNRRFREMVFPGIGHLIIDGITFEEGLRIAVQHGLPANIDGRAEEFVAERLARHRNPGAPFVQQRSDGSWVQINERKTSTGGTVIVYEDVTDLMQREEELAAANRDKDRAIRELNEVLDAIEFGVLFMDADLNVRMQNRAYREIWNLSADVLQSDKPLSLRDYYQRTRFLYDVPDEEWDGFVARRMQAIREGRTDPQESQLANGTILKRRCISLADGGRMLTYFDITELKRAQEELRLARDEAEEATRAKSRFLANMSHELRTPLNAVIGITELLKEEAQDEANENLIEPLQRIGAAGRHLLNLIDNILDLSKIEANRLEIQIDEFDVSQIIEDVVTTIEPLAAQNRNRLRVECADDLGTMRSDDTKVRQIMLNLLGNACKFTEQGEVALEVRRVTENGAGWLDMRVTDTGIGMDEKQLKRLFEEFGQGDAATTRRFGGTGLGLVISQRLCTILGGDISVTSRLGEGTTFTVRLPTEL